MANTSDDLRILEEFQSEFWLEVQLQLTTEFLWSSSRILIRILVETLVVNASAFRSELCWNYDVICFLLIRKVDKFQGRIRIRILQIR